MMDEFIYHRFPERNVSRNERQGWKKKLRIFRILSLPIYYGLSVHAYWLSLSLSFQEG